jgi:RNase adaptor protein for sRNA GlmZ degradation
VITLISFGFKYHRPPANNYIDVSFIKNPARQEGWTLFSKIDDKMIAFVHAQSGVSQALENLVNLIILLSGKDDDTRFAFGCSAGRHRSPIFVMLLETELKARGYEVKVKHLELEGD